MDDWPEIRQEDEQAQDQPVSYPWSSSRRSHSVASILPIDWCIHWKHGAGRVVQGQVQRLRLQIHKYHPHYSDSLGQGNTQTWRQIFRFESSLELGKSRRSLIRTCILIRYISQRCFDRYKWIPQRKSKGDPDTGYSGWFQFGWNCGQ